MQVVKAHSCYTTDVFYKKNKPKFLQKAIYSHGELSRLTGRELVQQLPDDAPVAGPEEENSLVGAVRGGTGPHLGPAPHQNRKLDISER